MATSLQKRIDDILDANHPGDPLHRAFSIFLVSLIALNIAALVLETMEPVYQQFPRVFQGIEIASIAIFSIEYLLRVWSCTARPEYRHPIKGRLRFAFSPLALIDLLAVLPFYLPFIGIDLRVVRAVRLMRIFRIAKLARYSAALRTLGRVFLNKKDELIAVVLIAAILLICASTMMYYVEHEAQPKEFSSIPATMWWAIETLTTVGYGDMYPVTTLGKFLGATIAVLGIGLFALPTGMLGAAFIEDWSGRKAKPVQCPFCGEHFQAEEHREGEL